MTVLKSSRITQILALIGVISLVVCAVLFNLRDSVPYPIGLWSVTIPVYLAPVGFLTLLIWIWRISLNPWFKVLLSIALLTTAIFVQFMVVVHSWFYFPGHYEVRHLPHYPTAESWNYGGGGFPDAGPYAEVRFDHATAKAEEVTSFYEVELIKLGWERVSVPADESWIQAKFRKGELVLDIRGPSTGTRGSSSEPDHEFREFNINIEKHYDTP